MIFQIFFILIWESICQNAYEYYVAKSPKNIVLSQNPSLYSDSESLFCNILTPSRHKCKNFENKGIFTKNPSLSLDRIIVLFASGFIGQKAPNFYSFSHQTLLEGAKNVAKKYSFPLNFEFNNNKDDEEDLAKNIDKNIEGFDINDLISSINEIPQQENSYQNDAITVGFFNAGEVKEEDFPKFNDFDEKTLIIIAVKSKKSESEIIDRITRMYSDGLCEFSDSNINCRTNINPGMEARLCNLNLPQKPVFNSVLCIKKSMTPEIQTRQYVSKNPHNLNTYAEYNSEYPVIFTMCLIVTIMVLIVSMVLFLVLGGIDTSQSILQRDTITKLKNE